MKISNHAAQEADGCETAQADMNHGANDAAASIFATTWIPARQAQYKNGE